MLNVAKNLISKINIDTTFLGISLLSIVLFSAIRLSSYGYGADSAGMLEQIHIFLETGIYKQTTFPPGFGVLAYPFYMLFENIPLSGVLLSYISYLVIIIFSFFICRFSNLNVTKSFFVCLIVALNPLLYTQSNVGYSEVVYTALLFIISFLFLRLRGSQSNFIYYALMIGLMFSICFLIRAEVLGCVAISLLFLVFLTKELNLNNKIVISAIILCAILFVVGVYAWYLYRQFGYVAITGKTDTVFFEYGGRIDTLLKRYIAWLEIKQETSVISYILSNPIIFAWRLFYNFVDLSITLFLAISYILLPVAAVVIFKALSVFFQANSERFGNYFAMSKKQVSTLFIVGTVVVLPVGFLLPFYIADRFIVAYSCGCSFILSFLLVKNISSSVSTILLAIVIGLFSLWHPYSWFLGSKFDFLPKLYAAPYSLTVAHTYKHWSVPYRKSAGWLRENTKYNENIVIASETKGHTILAFYNVQNTRHNNGRFFRVSELQEVESVLVALRNKADYVILNKYYSDELLFKKVLQFSRKNDAVLSVCEYDRAVGFMVIASIKQC